MTRAYNWLPEAKELIWRLHKSGMTYIDIANRVGVSRSAIRNICLAVRDKRRDQTGAVPHANHGQHEGQRPGTTHGLHPAN